MMANDEGMSGRSSGNAVRWAWKNLANIAALSASPLSVVIVSYEAHEQDAPRQNRFGNTREYQLSRLPWTNMWLQSPKIVVEHC